MRQRAVALIGCAAGVVLSGGLAVLFGATEHPNEPRYQLYTWSVSGVPNAAVNHGAYRLDAQTGEVLAIDSSAQAVKVSVP